MTSSSADQSNKSRPIKLGPQTQRGKLRASRNSTIHNLSVPSILTEEQEQRANSFARIICNGDKCLEIFEAAKCIAYAQLEVERVRKVRREHSVPAKSTSHRGLQAKSDWFDMSYAEAMTSVNFATLEKSEHLKLFGRRIPKKLIKAMIKAQGIHGASQEINFERYETRAISRRRSAIRNFYELVLENSKISNFGETNSDSDVISEA